MPVIATVTPLDRAALMEILTKPKNALVKQYQRMFELDGFELEFDLDALQANGARVLPCAEYAIP
mgnify:CR=1 FL=1